MPTKTRRRRIIAFLLASKGRLFAKSFSLLSHVRSPLASLDMCPNDQYSVGDDTAAPAVVRILGVCGGIGCGKSTACQMLVDPLGCIGLIDADKLAHIVYEPGSLVHDEIAAEFGSDLLRENGEIERSKLGAIVFNNSEAMSKLENLVWPHIRVKIEDRIKEMKRQATGAKHNIIVVEAALWLEAKGWHDLLDGLWLVQSSKSIAIKRLKDRRGMPECEAMNRIKAQEERGVGNLTRIEQEIEKNVVTRMITNEGGLENLRIELQSALDDPSSFKTQSRKRMPSC